MLDAETLFKKDLYEYLYINVYGRSPQCQSSVTVLKSSGFSLGGDNLCIFGLIYFKEIEEKCRIVTKQVCTAETLD